MGKYGIFSSNDFPVTYAICLQILFYFFTYKRAYKRAYSSVKCYEHDGFTVKCYKARNIDVSCCINY